MGTRGDENQVVYVDGDIPQLPLQLGQLLVDSSQVSPGNTNLQQCTSQNPLTYEPLQGGYPETPEEEAAGVTIVNYLAPPGNVIRYGADPSGSTDSTSAFQAAANVVPANVGGVVYIPRGTYNIGPIVLKPKTTLRGESYPSVYLNCVATAAQQSFISNAQATAGPDGTIFLSDFTLNLSNASTYYGCIGIDFRPRAINEHAGYCTIDRLALSNWNGNAIYMDKCWVASIGTIRFSSIKNVNYGTNAGLSYAIYINGNANGVVIESIHVSNCDAALRVAGVGTSAALTVTNGSFERDSSFYSGGYDNPDIENHFFIQGVTNFSFSGNYIEGISTGISDTPGTGAVMRIFSCNQATISGNYWQSDFAGTDYSYRHIRIEGGCQNVVITDNDFEDATNSHVAVEAGAEDTQIFNNRYVFGGTRETTMAAVRSHITGSCVLENNQYSQTYGYAANIAINTREGSYVSVGALTGNVTLTATNNPTLPGVPREMTVELLQDGVGGRTVTFSTGFAANSYSNTGNTANRNWRGQFGFDGSAWQLISHTGWY